MTMLTGNANVDFHMLEGWLQKLDVQLADMSLATAAVAKGVADLEQLGVLDEKDSPYPINEEYGGERTYPVFETKSDAYPTDEEIAEAEASVRSSKTVVQYATDEEIAEAEEVGKATPKTPPLVGEGSIVPVPPRAPVGLHSTYAGIDGDS